MLGQGEGEALQHAEIVPYVSAPLGPAAVSERKSRVVRLARQRAAPGDAHASDLVAACVHQRYRVLRTPCVPLSGFPLATFPQGELQSESPHGRSPNATDRQSRASANGTRRGKRLPAGRYSGAMVGGQPAGFGFALWPTRKYDGQWQQGREHGMGREAWSAGSCYSGGFADGLRSGYGVYSHFSSPHPCHMLGEVDVRDIGQGGWWSTLPYSQKWASERAGWVYAGQMRLGVRHGFGALASGSELYEGQFNEDKRHGFGVRMVRDQELWFETYDNDVCRMQYSPLRHDDLAVSVEASLNRISWSKATLLLSWQNDSASITVVDNKTTLPIGARAMISDILSLKIGDPVTPSFILQYRDHSGSIDGGSVKRTLEIQAGSEATFRLIFLALRLAIHEHRVGHPLSAPCGAEWFKNLNGAASGCDDAQGPGKLLGRFVRGSEGIDERFFKKVRECVAKADDEHRAAFYHSCLSYTQMTISASAHWHTLGGVGHDTFPEIEDLCQWLKVQSDKTFTPDETVSQIMMDRMRVILIQYMTLVDSKIQLDEQKLASAEASNDQGFGKMCEARVLALGTKKAWASELISVLEQSTKYIERGLSSFAHLRFTSSSVDDATVSDHADSSLSDAEISTTPIHSLVVTPTAEKTTYQSEAQSSIAESLSIERSPASIACVSPRGARARSLELSSSPSQRRYSVQDMSYSVMMTRSTIKTAKLLHCRRQREALSLDYEEAETLLSDAKGQMDQWLAAQKVVTIELRKRAELAEAELSRIQEVHEQNVTQMEEVMDFNENLLQRYARFRERTIAALASDVSRRCQRLAVLQWHCSVRHGKRMVCVAQKIVTRWIRIHVSGAFARLQYYAMDKKQLAAKAHSIVFKRANLALRNFLWNWVREVEDSIVIARLKKADSDLEYQQNRVAYLSGKAQVAAQCVLQKWIKRPNTRCFNKWAAAVHHAIHLKAKGLTVLLRRTRMNMSTSFVCWKDFTQHKFRLFRTARKILGRWVHGMALDVFIPWHILASKNRTLRRKTISVVRRWTQFKLLSPLCAWQDRTTECKRLRVASKKIIQGICIETVKYSFVCWKEKIVELRNMQTTLNRRQATVIDIVASFWASSRMQTLASSYYGWFHQAAALRRHKAICQRSTLCFDIVSSRSCPFPDPLLLI